MNRVPRYALAGILSALSISAQNAHAADLLPPEPAPLISEIPAANWSGFYGGSLVGYGWTDFDLDGNGSSSNASVEGSTGGGLIGHNWQSGPFVFGVEGDITLHLIRGEADGSGGLIPTDVDTLYTAHLRGRAGYDLGRFMPFLAGGLAFNESYIRDQATEFDGDVQRLWGWTIGAGVDFKLGDTFIGPVVLRAEYLYEDFSSELFSVAGGIEASQGTHFVRGAIIAPLDGSGFAPSSTGPVDWSGSYAGLMAGYGRTDVTTSGGGTTEDFDADGALGGIYTGRNFAIGNFILGYEGAILLTDVTGDGPQPNAADTSFRNNIQADLRARLGYAFGPVLPFVAGGVSWTRSEQETAGGQERGRVPADLWTIGAGVDYKVTDAVSLRAEYLYGQEIKATSPDFGGLNTDQELEMHQIRFGAAYHFN